MLKPRTYQENLVTNTSKSVGFNRAVITHSPTGSGKSLIILMIVQRALAKGLTVVVLSEATKVYNQLTKQVGGIEINSKVDKDLFIRRGACYVGMIQTLNRRPKMLHQLQELGKNVLLLIDECHISTSCSLIDKLPDAYRVGFTATPFAALHKHLPKYYFDLIEGPQVDWLIQEGFLCTYRHIARTTVDMNILELRNGEYSEDSQEKAFGESKVYAGLFEDLRTVPFKKAVIFVASIRAANKLNEELISHGFRSCVYHSGIANGSYELAKFTDLHLCNIVVTIKSLSKGWDFPPIDLVVLMHKTTSLSLYLQELGRGSRPIPGVKDRFTCLDYGDNWKQHGLYWDDRPYSELWKEQPKKRKREPNGVAPVKSCPKCESLISLMARTCSFCGEELPYTEKELEIGHLIEITEQYNSLIGRKISSLDANELAMYAKLKSKASYATRIAKAKDQEEPGWLMDFAFAMGYSSRWVTHQPIPKEKIEYADITLR